MRYSEINPDYVDYLDQVFVVATTPDGEHVEYLDESRKWVPGRFDRNIGIDQPSHLQGNGQVHAHVYGRRGEEVGVVNLNGTPSHGSQFRLHPKDADALRARGFQIPIDNLVEWMRLTFKVQLLLG